MSFDLSHNAPAVERALQAYVRRLPAAQKAALSEAGTILYVTSRRLLVSMVYQKEIPKWKNGNLKWRRKMRRGGILGAETFYITSDGLTYVVHTDPSSAPAKAITNWPGGYAQLRHDGDGGSNPHRDKGILHPAPWRTKAAQEGGPRAVRKFRDSLVKGMNTSNWRTL